MVNFNEQPTEAKIFKLTKDEVERLNHLDVKNPEDLKFLGEKGISLDSGNIVIETEDGKKIEMTTRSDDFGTNRLKGGEPIIPSGIKLDSQGNAIDEKTGEKI